MTKNSDDRQSTSASEVAPVSSPASLPNVPQIIVQMPPQPGLLKSALVRLLIPILILSLLLNYSLLQQNSNSDSGPQEAFVSGDDGAKERIAIIDVSGTIMPPFTSRIIEAVEHATDDDDVKGVILAIDSPGGFVADSHQIYHRLLKLAEKKPVYVSMKRIAASGGVYVAMGIGESGKIFAEPTTWTGSIGVIIPRYDLSGLAAKFGVASDSLTTGPFKDSLNPLRPMRDDERVVWDAIMDDSFDRFVEIVATGRKGLDEATVREKLATGQIFTANQALANGLIDAIAFEEEVVETLQKDLALEKVRVIRYQFPATLLDVLMGSAESQDPDVYWRKAMEATVPRAMYYCSWLPAL